MVVGYDVQHLYRYPVEKVFEANLKLIHKHPNKQTFEVKEVERRNDPDGLEYIKRSITSLNFIPKIVRKMGIMDEDNINTEEEIWMDRPGRRYFFRSHNLSFSESVTMQDTSTFVADANNPDWTRFEQAGAADMSNLGIVGKVVEVLFRPMMERNIQNNINIMEDVLKTN